MTGFDAERARVQKIVIATDEEIADVVDAITGGLLMPLVPGLAMTNAVQDAMRGDVLSGVGHGMQAVLTAVLVAGGSVVASRAVWTLLM